MSCENCKTGFKWDGQPTGREDKLNDKDVYVTGTSKEAAVLILSDIFGWKLPNTRLLADHYAKEANVTVYLPDILDGDFVHPDALSDPKYKFDLGAFIGRHSKDARYPHIKAAAQTLKSQYPKVAAIGFCYGGWASFKLASDPKLIDAIAVAHPSLLDKPEIDAVKVPVQVLAAEHDQIFVPELNQYTLETLPTLGVEWEYVYFPGLAHGFAVRGDPNDSEQKHGLERAKRCAVNFFNEYLH